MKKLILFLVMIFCATMVRANADVLGYWTTIDDETNEAKSVVRVYEYQGKVYGRVVKLLKNPAAKAKLPGEPAIQDLDIIWDLQLDDDKYAGGKILDPQKGKVYGCEMWRDGEKLIVRGKIAFLGRNQTWLPNRDMKGNQPLVPALPRLK
ncbi:MAG: DUF2147 domain-containing protein [Alphaproteobacteria bacterium]|nr:DUF2147 domain-containing protein [Alphaproteobacteria bacterium]